MARHLLELRIGDCLEIRASNGDLSEAFVEFKNWLQVRFEELVLPLAPTLDQRGVLAESEQEVPSYSSPKNTVVMHSRCLCHSGNIAMSSSIDRSVIRAAVQAYAADLCAVLEHNLGVLTEYGGSDRCLYQSADLEPHEDRKITDWSEELSGALQDEQQSGAPFPPQTEDNVMQEWSETEFREPLLIVAPAGSGKSCLLESFALKMARDLVEDCNWLSPTGLPWVPLIISLAHVKRSLIDFLLRAENPGRKHIMPTLSPEVLQVLRDERRLLLLLDGFDEVPQLQEGLVGEIPQLGCAFALTSRPGNGEWKVVRDDRHRTIQELTEHKGRNYVNRYFAWRRSPAILPEDAERRFAQAWSGRMRQLLVRPLYLKAWCDSLRENLSPPNSLDQLGDQLLRTTFRAREVFPADLRQLPLKLAIDRFVEWFGRLGLSFIEDNFDVKTSNQILEHWHSFAFRIQPSSDGQLTDVPEYVSAACKAGLLIYSDSGQSYRLPKMPLVEYVIGKAAALDAATNPRAPQLLLDLFSRLIWQPKLHDILDYTFDALWCSPEGHSQRHWATALLEQTTEIDWMNLFMEKDGRRPMLWDLEHPFSFGVLRWALPLLYQPAPREWKRATTLLDDLVRTALWMPNKKKASLAYWPGFVVDKLVGRILSRYPTDTDLKSRQPEIEYVAFQIDPMDAVIYIHKWANTALQTENDEIADLWTAAIAQAACQVPSDNILDIAAFLLGKQREARALGRVASSWLGPISSAVMRIPRDHSSNLIQLLAHAHEEQVDDHDMRRWLRTSIRYIAFSVPADSADEVVRTIMRPIRLGWSDETAQWWNVAAFVVRDISTTAAATLHRILLDQLLDSSNPAPVSLRREMLPRILSKLGELDLADSIEWIVDRLRTTDDVAERIDWIDIVSRAASHLGHESAIRFTEQFIQLSHVATSDDERWSWNLAITSAASGVADSRARACIEDWLQKFTCLDECEQQQRYAFAIHGAAAKIDETYAPELIRYLLLQAQQPANGYLLWFCIAPAATRLGGREASGIGDTLLDSLNDIAIPFERLEIVKGIANVASRLEPEDTARFVAVFVELSSQASDRDESDQWLQAIEAAVVRVPRNESALITEMLISHLCRAPVDKRERWLPAIAKAAGRVDVKQVTTFINILIEAMVYTCSTYRYKSWTRRRMFLTSIEYAIGWADDATLAELLYTWSQRYEQVSGARVRDAIEEVFRLSTARLCQASMERFCNRLIAIGLARLAREIARDSLDVAILQVARRYPQGHDWSRPSTDFVAVLRKDLTLDLQVTDSEVEFTGDAIIRAFRLRLGDLHEQPEQNSARCDHVVEVDAGASDDNNPEHSLERRLMQLSEEYNIPIEALRKPLEPKDVNRQEKKDLRVFYEIGWEFRHHKDVAGNPVCSSVKEVGRALASRPTTAASDNELPEWRRSYAYLKEIGANQAAVDRSRFKMERFFKNFFGLGLDNKRTLDLFLRRGKKGFGGLTALGVFVWEKTGNYLSTEKLL